MELKILFLFVTCSYCQILGGWNVIDVNSIPDIVLKAAKDKLTSENKAFKTFSVVSAKEQVSLATLICVFCLDFYALLSHAFFN